MFPSYLFRFCGRLALIYTLCLFTSIGEAENNAVAAQPVKWDAQRAATQAGTQVAQQTATQAGTQATQQTATQTGAQVAQQTATQAGTQVVQQTATQADTQVAQKAKGQSSTKTTSQPAVKAETQSPTKADTQTVTTADTETVSPEEPSVDFENPDTFIDVSEALRSKQYVHRAILSTMIKHTSHFSFGRFYLNHLLGFSNVWQRRTPVVKYTTGLQGISAGYVTKSGHGLELGFEFSAVSNIVVGYKYLLQTEKLYSVWPYLGLGAGHEVTALKLANGPPEAQRYVGNATMGYAIVGILVPLIDVGLKAEVRANFYSMDRVVLTQGLGAVIFL